MKNKISIIMITYNALDFIKKSIESTEKLTSYPFELIIIDNNSEEETVNYLKTLTDKHNIIFNDSNRLFAAANNQGILASDPESKYLMLLNSDIEVLHPDWIQQMINLIESKPNIGIVGPKHNYRPVAPIYGAIDGWCFMFKREVFNQVGLFNAEKFPWNGSPNDFTISAFKKGWLYKHFLKSEKYIHHFGKQSRKENAEMLTDIPYDYQDLLAEHNIRPVKINFLWEKTRKTWLKNLSTFKRFYQE